MSRLLLFFRLLWQPYEGIRIDWATAWKAAGIIHGPE